MAEPKRPSSGVARPCADCARTLFGALPHCPFCGSALVAAGVGTRNASPAPSTTRKRPEPVSATEAQPVVIPKSVAAPTSAETPVSAAAVAAPAVNDAKPVEPVTDAPSAPPASGSTTKSGGKKMLWISVAVVAAAGAWLALQGGPNEQCKVSLADAERLAATDPRQASVRVDTALKACNGNASSTERAAVLVKTLQPMLQALDACDRTRKDAENQMADGRVRQAQRLLAAQPAACAARPDMIVLRQAGEDARRNAADKLVQARSEVSEGRAEAAQGLADEAEKLDRESPELARTRRLIDAKAKEISVAAKLAEAQAAAAAAAPSIPNEALRPLPTFESRPTVQAQVAAAPPALDARRVECDVLVRGGNRALANRSYDVAMQQADEALAAFPNCPGAADLGRLARQAKDRARAGVVIQ